MGDVLVGVAFELNRGMGDTESFGQLGLHRMHGLFGCDPHAYHRGRGHVGVQPSPNDGRSCSPRRCVIWLGSTRTGLGALSGRHL